MSNNHVYCKWFGCILETHPKIQLDFWIPGQITISSLFEPFRPGCPKPLPPHIFGHLRVYIRLALWRTGNIAILHQRSVAFLHILKVGNLKSKTWIKWKPSRVLVTSSFQWPGAHKTAKKPVEKLSKPCIYLQTMQVLTWEATKTALTQHASHLPGASDFLRPRFSNLKIRKISQIFHKGTLEIYLAVLPQKIPSS